MRLRLLLIIGLVTGYILGARAGRSGYVKLKSRASDAWEDPRIQKAVADTQEFVKENAPIVADKVAEGAKVAGDKVSEGAKSAAENIGAVTEKVVDSARIAGTSFGEGARLAMDAARQAAERLAEGAKGTADKVASTAKSTAKTVSDRVAGANGEPGSDSHATNDAAGVGAPKKGPHDSPEDGTGR